MPAMGAADTLAALSNRRVPAMRTIIPAAALLSGLILGIGLSTLTSAFGLPLALIGGVASVVVLGRALQRRDIGLVAVLIVGVVAVPWWRDFQRSGLPLCGLVPPEAECVDPNHPIRFRLETIVAVLGLIGVVGGIVGWLKKNGLGRRTLRRRAG